MTQIPYSLGQRELPNSIDAEQAILGALLVNNASLDAVPATFDADHFYEPIHRDIFREVSRLRRAGKIANPVTVKAALPSDKRIGDMTVSQYLARLAAEAVSMVNVPDYAAAITFYAMRRGIISLGEQAQETGHEFSEELTFMEQIEAMRDQFERIAHGLEGESERTLSDAADSAIDATSNASAGKGVHGVDYGFAPLMNMVGPFMPTHLIVIGGGTKQGKSSLIEQMIMGAALNGHPVWAYSGEMKAEELAHRALSRSTDIQAWRQIRGKVSDIEVEKLISAKTAAKSWQDHVFIRDEPMTVAQIERSVAAFSKRHPNGMVVIDHIGLVEKDKNTWRLTDTEFGPIVTRSLKMLAAKCGLPIVAAAQLKKNTFAIDDGRVDRKTFQRAVSRRPKYADILGSVEKDANMVIIPFRAEPILQELEPLEGSELYGDWEAAMERVKDKAEIILALSRHARWPQRKEVGWSGPKTMFTDLSDTGQARFL